jgi:bifunctional ADP-heptose synthase (sugar kinase/adenylyltransferase)
MAMSVYDVTGAGDTAISTFAAAVAGGANRELAVYMANLAGSIKVAKRGTNTVTVEEILSHLSENEFRSIEARESPTSATKISVRLPYSLPYPRQR